MAITYVSASTCAGCGAAVNVWFDGLHHVFRDRSMVESPVHLCHEPTKRERIEMDFMELMAFRCPRCGDPGVALTNWGRIVDFPNEPSAEGWAEAWVGPLQEHVCPNTAPLRGDPPRRAQQQRPTVMSGVVVPEL